ncbi:hypothetical protein [Nocardia sp. BMG51109]|uniref:hypothetical protein n=1 Tax=Nocardia sp. BMG51109 TaxID=1056816 RepID=UPI000466B1F9|nr:hypothetical protein [Nocardia sp. BMG51109]
MSLRLSAAIVGTLAAIGGSVVLWLPISLEDPATSGRPIACGSAFRVDTSHAESVDFAHRVLHPGTPYESITGQCYDRAARQQHIGWPIALGGAVVLAGAILIRSYRSRVMD